MSWWTKLRDAAESVASTASVFDIRSSSARKEKSGITGAANRVRNAEEGLFNKVTGRPSASDTRQQRNMVNDQIQAYKDQTELTRQQLNEAREQTASAKRQVQEKQIRSLRRNYRAQGAGLLGVGQPATADTATTLGG